MSPAGDKGFNIWAFWKDTSYIQTTATFITSIWGMAKFTHKTGWACGILEACCLPSCSIYFTEIGPRSCKLKLMWVCITCYCLDVDCPCELKAWSPGTWCWDRVQPSQCGCLGRMLSDGTEVHMLSLPHFFSLAYDTSICLHAFPSHPMCCLLTGSFAQGPSPPWKLWATVNLFLLQLSQTLSYIDGKLTIHCVIQAFRCSPVWS